MTPRHIDDQVRLIFKSVVLGLSPDGSVALRHNLPNALWDRVTAAREERSLGISFVSERCAIEILSAARWSRER